MKTLVPPAPISSPTSDEKPKIVPTAQKIKSPFDAEFLKRVYRSMLVFGALATLLAAFGLKSTPATDSFVGGIVLAALMLRAQELSVRSMLRPAGETGGFDLKMLMLLALPLKFIGIGALLWMANSLGWLKLAPFTLGFGFAQLVLLCQVAGWLLRRALARSK